jgi:hypothetical protein
MHTEPRSSSVLYIWKFLNIGPGQCELLRLHLPSAEVNSVVHSGRVVRGADEGFSSPVYWLLVCLFLLVSAAMVCFFGLIIHEQRINREALMVGRFDHGESLRIVFAG